MSRISDIRAEAWRIHLAEGHPVRYEGPCWGPTQANIEQAKRNLAKKREHRATSSQLA